VKYLLHFINRLEGINTASSVMGTFSVDQAISANYWLVWCETDNSGMLHQNKQRACLAQSGDFYHTGLGANPV
jgi:hypothetical protein